MTSWLTSWLTGWLTDWLTSCLAGWSTPSWIAGLASPVDQYLTTWLLLPETACPAAGQVLEAPWAPAEGWAAMLSTRAWCVQTVCVCVRARARVCVCVCARARVCVCACVV